MGHRYKQVCVGFFYSWTLFLWIFPCYNIISCQSFIRCTKLPSPSLMQWNTMPRCMTSFTLERRVPCTFVAITHNNDVVWFMSWTPPSLTSLMTSYIMSPIQINIFFHGGGWTWRLVAILLFFHIGGSIIQSHKLSHVNNPWFFIMIFIGLFIIRFIVINV
jgi:hypothetical protein